MGDSPRLIKKIKNDIIYIVARGLITFFKFLPRRLALFCGRMLGYLAYLTAGHERRRAQQNLAHIGYRSGAVCSRDCKRLIVKMFQHLGTSAMECVLMDRRYFRLHPSEDWIRFKGNSKQILLDALARKRGVVFVTAHLGNWELMGAAVARVWALRHQTAVPVNNLAITKDKHPSAADSGVSVFFKPSYDPRFTRLICRFRRQHGVEGIDVTDSQHIRQAIRTLKSGRVLGLLLDQPVTVGDVYPFLGKPACTSRIVPLLVRATGASVIFGYINRIGLCQHEISLVEIKMPNNSSLLNELTPCIQAKLEQAIKIKPSQWIWSLNRWRLQDS